MNACVKKSQALRVCLPLKEPFARFIGMSGGDGIHEEAERQHDADRGFEEQA